MTQLIRMNLFKKMHSTTLKKVFYHRFLSALHVIQILSNPSYIIPDVQPRMSEVSNNSKTLFTVKFNGTNPVSVSSTASKEGKVTENGGSSCKCSRYIF